MRKGLQLLAAALVLAGLAIGHENDVPRAAEPPRLGDEWILAGDFHVHSFPGDGGLPPWDLAREARRRGLDVIALTNHNHRLSWRLASLLPQPTDGALLIPGEELTSTGYHMTALGTAANVPWRQRAASAIRGIHSLDGIAIAAHPARASAKGYDDEAMGNVDGVEVACPFVYQERTGRADLEAFYNRVRARQPSAAAIGSTDFHYFAPVGYFRTYVFVRDRSAAGVLDAIRRGRTVACDSGGETYGPSELTAAVAGRCRGAATPASRPHPWRDPASLALVWSGLVALVVVGFDDR